MNYLRGTPSQRKTTLLGLRKTMWMFPEKRCKQLDVLTNQTRFCRKVIWFKPLFPLCQWVRWVQTWSASLGIPRPLKPPSDRTTSGFCRASAVFCFGTFFLGQLEKLHQILPGFRYIWKRERWMEVFFEGWGGQRWWRTSRKSPKSAAKPRPPTLQSTLCHMVHPPTKSDGPQEHERLETISKAQPCKLHHWAFLHDDRAVDCSSAMQPRPRPTVPDVISIVGHCHWRWSVKAMKRRGLSGTKSSGGADLLLPWCLVGSELCGGSSSLVSSLYGCLFRRCFWEHERSLVVNGVWCKSCLM